MLLFREVQRHFYVTHQRRRENETNQEKSALESTQSGKREK